MGRPRYVQAIDAAARHIRPGGMDFDYPVDGDPHQRLYFDFERFTFQETCDMIDSDNIESGFNGTLEFGRRPVLLVVDFQRGFTDPTTSPLGSDVSKAVAATNKLIEAMRGVGQVIFTILGYDQNLSDIGIWVKKGTTLNTLKRGTVTCDLDPRLNFDALKDLLLYKTQPSAFFGTALPAILHSNQCDSLIVAGCATSGCVRASVVDAIQYAFAPFVVEDCTADRSAAQHQSNLTDMQSKYAEVVSLESMLSNLKQLPNATTR